MIIRIINSFICTALTKYVLNKLLKFLRILCSLRSFLIIFANPTKGNNFHELACTFIFWASHCQSWNLISEIFTRRVEEMLYFFPKHNEKCFATGETLLLIDIPIILLLFIVVVLAVFQSFRDYELVSQKNSFTMTNMYYGCSHILSNLGIFNLWSTSDFTILTMHNGKSIV